MSYWETHGGNSGGYGQGYSGGGSQNPYQGYGGNGGGQTNQQWNGGGKGRGYTNKNNKQWNGGDDGGVGATTQIMQTVGGIVEDKLQEKRRSDNLRELREMLPLELSGLIQHAASPPGAAHSAPPATSPI